jgi:iron-sulfur cluster assembly accessory protein
MGIPDEVCFSDMEVGLESSKGRWEAKGQNCAWNRGPTTFVKLTIMEIAAPEYVVESQAIVELTASAAEELKRLAASEARGEDKVLRLGVKGGGCSGLSYILDYDAVRENDYVYEQHGVLVAVDKAQAMYLFGMKLNYEQGLNARGFTFDNPNAQSTCGCGTSFAI